MAVGGAAGGKVGVHKRGGKEEPGEDGYFHRPNPVLVRLDAGLAAVVD